MKRTERLINQIKILEDKNHELIDRIEHLNGLIEIMKEIISDKEKLIDVLKQEYGIGSVKTNATKPESVPSFTNPYLRVIK